MLKLELELDKTEDKKYDVGAIKNSTATLKLQNVNNQDYCSRITRLNTSVGIGLCFLNSCMMHTRSNDTHTNWLKDYLIFSRSLLSLTLQVYSHQPRRFIGSIALWFIGLDLSQQHCNASFMIYMSSCLHVLSSKI